MKKHTLKFLALVCVMASPAVAQFESSEKVADAPSSIAWYGTWKVGAKAAVESGKPILLVSAAPHCHNVSGIW